MDRDDLGRVKIVVQDRLSLGGCPLLMHLDRCIQECWGVVHLVGDSCGERPQASEVNELMTLYRDLEQKLPEIRDELTQARLHPDKCPFTYTQWEAFMTIYHVRKGRPLKLFPCFAIERTVRRKGWKREAEEAELQDQHAKRVRSFGFHWAEFTNIDDIAEHLRRILSHEEEPGERPSREVVWPIPSPNAPYQIADRREQYAFFHAFITGNTEQRIYMIQGAPGYGKSTLVEQFLQIVSEPPMLDCAYHTFSGHNTLTTVLCGMRNRLVECGKSLPLFDQTSLAMDVGGMREAFIADLNTLDGPLLLWIDAFEAADADAQQWIRRSMLPEVAKHPGIRTILSGQEVPRSGPQEAWAKRSKTHKLPPIDSPKDWTEWAVQHFNIPQAHLDQLGTLVKAARGIPAMIAPLIMNLDENA